jgi:hypothetical protein
MDVSKFIVAKSDQLNSDDLMGGPITVKIMGIKEGSKEQPVILEIDQGRQPFKPCKSMLRVFVAAWGLNAREWIGRSVTLFRDPEVIYAGVKIGGIRIAALSEIASDLDLMITEKRGKKKAYSVKKLNVSKQAQPATQQATAPALMSESVFAEKMPAVEQAIASGKITHEAAIARLEKSGLLTEEQKKTVMSCAGPAQEAEATPEAAPDSDMFG